MKRYAITSKSAYRYSAPASHSYHLTRLMPAQSRDQTVLQSGVEVAPSPAHEGAQSDFFGNTVQWFSLDQAHETISFTMRATVEVERSTPLLAPTINWEDAAASALKARRLDSESPAHFLRSTSHTVADAPLRIFATRFFHPGAPLDGAMLAMSKAIQCELRYDSKATTVETTAGAAFAAGAGVCQDFAHIMIAACRSAGIPARYVSGYIRTDPPPGQPRLEGADAMHAWVSVWMGPNAGWMDFDPTNGCRVGEDHIVVAAGRDYQDTPPVRGEVVGGGEQSHTVSVDVVERS
jgi:transglutaminase-like putative cysteine protease